MNTTAYMTPNFSVSAANPFAAPSQPLKNSLAFRRGKAAPNKQQTGKGVKQMDSVTLPWGVIVTAICGLFGVLATQYVTFRNGRAHKADAIESKARLAQAETEIDFQRDTLSFSAFMSEWDSVNREIHELMQDSCIDRFMLLRAWNGYLQPRWTTSIFQQRLSGQQPIDYIHFELDEDYVARIRDISGGRPMSFTTKDAPISTIKDVYEAEGVTASVWCHIASEVLPGTQSRAITYCSFSTHSASHIDEPIKKHIETRCIMLASRLKGLVYDFEAPNEAL